MADQPDQAISIPNLPLPLRWQVAPERWSADGGALAITSGASTDLFVDPDGGAVTLNAPCALVSPPGDFMLSARVTVDFAAMYDAGALLLYQGERAWGKLALEYSPQRRPTVVTVVTRGVSDDCNSFTIDGNQLWLRIARLGPAFAFHVSNDGRYWQLIRYFATGVAEAPAVGFLAQSPSGQGCTASFDAIAYAPERLGDLRGGA